ncbi:hypothetical protein FRC17_005224 [Serendipita sp. 399]|nr:hypothetical protein FRC17_005224 [Serendipita sp. 399]
MISHFVLLSLLPILRAAAADSPAPCTSGTCTYSSGNGIDTAYSILSINTEKPTSLSDITSAAGWDIIECDPYSVGPQDVRLVCTDRSKGCDQLFEGGEENTIVLLPETCAGGPFARVVKSWVPENQSLPARLAKRQIDQPVRALTLDFDFSQIPVSNGRVYITASATNSIIQRDSLVRSAAKRSLTSIRHATRSGQTSAVVRDFIEASQKRSSMKMSRGFFDTIGDAFNSAVDAVSGVVDDAKDAITGAAEQVGDTLQDVGDTIQDGVEHAVDTVHDGLGQVGNTIGQVVDSTTGAVESFVHSLDDATSFNETISKNLNVLDVDQTFPVFTASANCPAQGPIPAIQTSIAVTAAVKAKLDAEVGFIVIGSVVPPQIDDLAFTSLLHGNIAASFSVKAGVKGTFDTGLIPLVEAGLPGLSFPGFQSILNVGPKISLNAQGKASLGVTANVTISSSLDLPQVNLVFPPSQGQSIAQAAPGSTPVQVDVGGSAELKGRAELHLVPRLEIGVEILSGAAETTVFLNVDNSAAIEFTLSAGAEFTPVAGTIEQPVVDVKEVETKFGGSVGADLGVSIDAGAKAALLPFFDQSVTVNLFSKKFPIFKKTFGNPVKKRSEGGLLARAREQLPSTGNGGLICPLSAEISIQQPILNELIPAPAP